MNDHLALEFRVAKALRHACPDGPLSELERCYPHAALVAATRTVAARSPWMISVRRPVGLVTGSGGARLRLPHVSTLAALVASGVPGTTIVKAGSSDSRHKDTGSVRCARRLGLPVAHSAQALLATLERHDLAIVDTAAAYPWLYSPLIFTFPFVVEALDLVSFTPCPASWKVNGVASPDVDRHRARFATGGPEHVLVIWGLTDRPEAVLDEASSAGTTFMLHLGPCATATVETMEPEDAGITRTGLAQLLVPTDETLEANAAKILDGSADEAHIQLVALNAGIMLLQAGAVSDVPTGVELALTLLRDGSVARCVNATTH